MPVGTSADVNVGDFNGDGRDDIFTRQNVSGLFVLRSTGSSFVNTPFGTLMPNIPYIGFRLGDFNGDGLDDIAGFTGTGASTIYRSTGNTFAPVSGGLLPIELVAINPSDIVVGDFNRDGKDDLLIKQTLTTTVNHVTTTTQNLYVAAGTAAGPFSSSLWGTLNGSNSLTMLGIGNY
jgi:hypothetical protein